MENKDRLGVINQHLRERRLDEAEHELGRVHPVTAAEHRAKAHCEGVLLFYRGDVVRARTRMEDAASAYGENVNLVRDLMICQYHQQDIAHFRASLTRLELLLLENEACLSSRSLVESEVWLGKFMEEEARLAPAQLFYDRALARECDPPYRLLALIQKARWQALYEPGVELSHLYRDLISLSPGSVGEYLRAEMQHSLMLIELRLIGGDHAWARVERAQDDLLELDRRLLVFDFVEGALGQDLKLHADVRARLNAFEGLDPYEEFVRDLVNGPIDHDARIHRLTEIAPRLTWSSHLRLLCLSANLESNPSLRLEYNRKIQLIIGALDPRSQTLWRKRLKQAMATPEVRVDLSVRARTVAIQGRTLDLSKKKIGLQLLSGLLEKSTLSVDEAIALLWQSSFTPEHYHRLRMSTHRLNTLIHEGTGVGKVIEVDSQTVRLRPEVRLNSADALTEDRFFDA